MSKKGNLNLYQKSRSNTIGKRKGHDISAYQNLANAIVYTAVRDYQHALIILHMRSDDKAANHRVYEVKQFFKSGYFKILTSIDPEYLLERAEEQVKERGYKRFYVGYGD